MSGATLASDERVLEAALAIGARTGVDYTDDAAVTALLGERRRAMDATQRGPLVWLGGLALTVGAIWPFLAPSLPALAGRPVLAYGPAGPLLILAATALTYVRTRWRRELDHPALAGYREVLGVARAHGLPPTHIPAWLEGRSSSGSGKGAAPIPSYPSVEPLAGRSPSDVTARERTAPADPAADPVAASVAEPVAVPAKPAAVAEYERIADAGGWHNEGGCLLVFAGAGGPSGPRRKECRSVTPRSPSSPWRSSSGSRAAARATRSNSCGPRRWPTSGQWRRRRRLGRRCLNCRRPSAG
ncbi:hypothetical protein OG985_20505 [Streptomyces sp. NBC_00289]|uniref:hypothetical protein n=1 Tax=Streptomyces sp. NBC_00289 TaxID=2975703 RepID=UPI00324BE8D8